MSCRAVFVGGPNDGETGVLDFKGHIPPHMYRLPVQPSREQFLKGGVVLKEQTYQLKSDQYGRPRVDHEGRYLYVFISETETPLGGPCQP